MVYGAAKRPNANQIFLEYVRDNPEWIALGLAAVNRWQEGINGVRVPLQQVVAMAIQEAYFRGKNGLPPADTRKPTPPDSQPQGPQNEPFKPLLFGRRRRPDTTEKPYTPVVARRRRV